MVQGGDFVNVSKVLFVKREYIIDNNFTKYVIL